MSYPLASSATRYLRRRSATTTRNLGVWIEHHMVPHLTPDGFSKRKRRQRQRNQDGNAATSNKPSYRFVDKVRLRVAAGAGGKGSVSVERIPRKHKIRPNGGHGGHGGSVIVVADPTAQSLWQATAIQAEKGANGSGQHKGGRHGHNKIIRVPCGVVVRKLPSPAVDLASDWDEYDEEEGEEDDDGNDFHFHSDEEEEGNEMESSNDMMDDSEYHPEDNRNLDIEFGDAGEMDDDEDNGAPSIHTRDDPLMDDFVVNGTDLKEENFSQETEGDEAVIPDNEPEFLADLDQPGAYVVVARGGRGGYGSMLHASKHGPIPRDGTLERKAQPQPGEVAYLELELKLIADIGLVGFPNAGKSSLLRAMSRATPEVAPYPFTTLHPLMGVIEYRDGMKVRVADIPGLIAGASQGRGKGIDFLRHLERTKALCYMLDAAGTEGRDPHEDLRVLVDELSSYEDGDLLSRDALVVANKVDLIETARLEELVLSLQETADSLGIVMWGPVFGISAGVSGHGLQALSKEMRLILPGQ